MSRLLFPGVAACIASITLSSSGVTRNVPVCVRVYDECGGSDLKKMREKNISFVEAKRLMNNSNFARKKEISPEEVVTPGIYVDRVVEVANPGSERQMIENDVRYPAGGAE